MRSVFATALCLSLIHTSVARVPHSFRDVIDRDAEPAEESSLLSGLSNWFSRIFKISLSIRQSDDDDGTCYEDDYFVLAEDMGQQWCSQYLTYDNVTTTADVYTYTFTTRTHTDGSLVRTTPHTTKTVTVTAGPPTKRDAEPAAITAPAGGLSQRDIEQVFERFRRQVSTDASNATWSASMSSACSCQDYTGPTVTVTYTDETYVETLLAIANTHITDISTTTAIPIVDSTTTLTVSAPVSATTSVSASGSASDSVSTSTPASAVLSTTGGAGAGSTPTQGSSSSSAAMPTGTPFTCPDDNNTTSSELVGNERFDYLILCDTVLMDPGFYSGALTYSSFAECAGACSIANQNFDYPVCQGVSFYGSSGSSDGNCFLKSSANDTVPAPGVNSALLQRILIGISPNNTDAGTTTESAPFSGDQPTQGSSQISSSMLSIMSGSSNSMPMVTPTGGAQSGRLNQAPITAFSTYVSAGSTYSSGTVYSFATTYPNGSWVSSYYTSYTEAWTASTTVYGFSAEGTSIASSSNSQTEEQNDDNGDTSIITTTTSIDNFPGGYNETIVTTNQTYASNGSEIASSATTQFFSYETGSSESGTSGGSSAGASGLLPSSTASSNSTNGNGSGGSENGGSGGIGSGSPAVVTSTSIFSSQTVIVNSGGTGGASSAFGAGGPNSTETVIVNTYGTAYGSGYVVSGQATITGTGGPTPVLVSSTATSFGTGSASSTQASGGPSSSPTGSFSNGSGNRSPGFDSTSSAAIPIFSSNGGGYSPPGNAPTSSTGSFSDTGAPRSPGTGSSTPTANGTVPVSPLSTGPSDTGSVTSIPGFPSSYGGYGGYSFPPPSSPSPTDSFSNSGAPRSPFPSSSTPTSNGTAPISPLSTGLSGTGPLSSGPSPYSYTGATRNGSQTTYPTGTGTSWTPSNSSSTSFSNTNAPRSGTIPTSSTTSPPPGSFSNGYGNRSGYPYGSSSHTTHGSASTSVSFTGAPRSPFPSSNTATTCANMTMGTTTIWSTTTVLGCYSSCAPPGGWGYGYGGPQSFGPPAPANAS